MGMSTVSGPWRSLAGFMEPVIYVKATDVVAGEVQIPAGANVVILSPADGGPAAPCALVLPEVVSGPFSLTNQPADVRYNGIQGRVSNYGAVAHTLKGFGTQPVSGNAAGVTIAAASVVQWGGNGNQAAPWLAVSTPIIVA